MEERSRTAGRLQRVEFVEKMGHRQGRFWSRVMEREVLKE